MVGHIVKIRFAILLLSIGLAATYFYAALSSLQHPNDWIGFFPAFFRVNPLANTFLVLFSIFEIALSAWLVSGIQTTLAALISTALMVAIILTNPAALLVTFRDIGLAFASIALAVLAKH